MEFDGDVWHLGVVHRQISGAIFEVHFHDDEVANVDFIQERVVGVANSSDPKLFKVVLPCVPGYAAVEKESQERPTPRKRLRRHSQVG